MTATERITVFKGSPSHTITVATRPKPTAIKPDEVLLRITHSGVCGTDAHFTGADIVLGHEGVGIVEKVGSAVNGYAIGHRVGFGYVHDGCGLCTNCLIGLHWHCTTPSAAPTPAAPTAMRAYGQTDFDQGSFATHAVWPATLLRHIPEGMDSADAAPLMCAGQTVFVPFVRLGIRGGERVGVVGIGGLGHLAVQFAARSGCQTVAISGSEGKRQEAMDLGATELYATKGVDAIKVERLIDFLIVTTSQLPDWKLFLPLMAPFSKIILLTVSADDIVIPTPTLIAKELSLVGSCSATPKEVQQMLDFATFHKIKPVVEQFPMTQSGVTEALEKMKKGEMRYRGVLRI